MRPERADVRVLALRTSTYGRAGEPAPVHPHLFRHARVRQIVRTTKSLPIAQKQAGSSRLQMAYLTVSDDEIRQAMQSVRDLTMSGHDLSTSFRPFRRARRRQSGLDDDCCRRHTAIPAV